MTKPGMAAQPVSWAGEGPLTFEDVSKLFFLPIAEAAQQLSVSGSVLQHICKENGIPRWPYRKFIAGKSVEEIREEGLKEMAANASAHRKGQKQQTTQSPTKPPLATLKSTPPSTPSMPKGPKSATGAGQPLTMSSQLPQHLHKTMPVQGKLSVNGKTPAQKPSQQSLHLHRNVIPGSHVRPMGLPGQSLQKQKVAVAAPPADDFKIGFPSKGLSRLSTRWWGSGESDSIRTENVAAGKEEGLLLSETETVRTEATDSTTASSLLVRIRKKAALRGQNLLPHAITRGYGIHRLGAKDAAILRFVFGDHLPKHWVASLPPIS